MASIFLIEFSLNGIHIGYMYVDENMLFSEVASHFFKNFPMVPENETSFFYDLNPIKSDSTKNLKQLGIKNMSKIEVKTNMPIYNSLNIYYENMNMSKDKSSDFDIIFFVNGVLKGSMHVVENMLFCEVVYHFCKNFSLKENEASFFFNSKEIKSDSTKKLRKLRIKYMSIIDVKTKTPINNPFNFNYNLSQLNMHNNSENSEYEKFLNVNFNYQGKTIYVQATRDTKFSELSKKFCLEADIRDKDLRYIINSIVVHPTCNRTLAELKITNLMRIEAYFQNQICG